MADSGRYEDQFEPQDISEEEASAQDEAAFLAELGDAVAFIADFVDAFQDALKLWKKGKNKTGETFLGVLAEVLEMREREEEPPPPSDGDTPIRKVPVSAV